MPRKPSLEELEQKRATLDARIQTERAKLRVRTRKQENRRKVLAGAAVLFHADQDPVFKKTLMNMIDGFLSREDERAAFDLPSRRQSPENAAVSDNMLHIPSRSE